MSDPIVEARENLHAALLLIDESMDALAAIEYAMEKADAYALAVLDKEHSTTGYPGGCNCTTWGDGARCRRYKKNRARIGQGQSPGE